MNIKLLQSMVRDFNLTRLDIIEFINSLDIDGVTLLEGDKNEDGKHNLRKVRSDEEIDRLFTDVKYSISDIRRMEDRLQKIEVNELKFQRVYMPILEKMLIKLEKWELQKCNCNGDENIYKRGNE